MTKKEYFTEYTWKTREECNFCYKKRTNIVYLYAGWKICKKCFLKGEENND